jgi:hypothetical protein
MKGAARQDRASGKLGTTMRTIRKANFFYPGFEHAGVETRLDRVLTGLFCAVAGVAISLYDALGADHPRRRRAGDGFEG